jgi:hypothetical protein
MTGSHRSVVVRALTMFALIGRPRSRSAQAETRITPPGDAITGSPGCWRVLFWHNLQRAGFIDLVGTLPPQGCGLPDVVLMHLGNTYAVTCTATAGGVGFTVSGHF